MPQTQDVLFLHKVPGLTDGTYAVAVPVSLALSQVELTDLYVTSRGVLSEVTKPESKIKLREMEFLALCWSETCRVSPCILCHCAYCVTVPSVSLCLVCHHAYCVTVPSLLPCLLCHCA